MSKIDNYCIQSKNVLNDNWYFVTGYKTLPTMKKKYLSMLKLREKIKNNFPHKELGSLRLVARDYFNNIIKVYQED